MCSPGPVSRTPQPNRYLPTPLTHVHIYLDMRCADFICTGWKTVFHSAWKTFDTNFQPILTKLKRHSTLLSSERIAAEVQSLQESTETKAAERHQSVEDKFHELSLQLQKLHLEDKTQKVAQQEQRLQEKRQFVLVKIDAPDFSRYDLHGTSFHYGASQSSLFALVIYGTVEF